MIPILDLAEQNLPLQAEINAAIQAVVDSSQFILGPPVREFERRVATYCQCAFGVGVASGTDALRLAFAALQLRPGDEVITSPFTFIATGNTISHSGATPVFVDIEPDTFNIAPAAIEAAITPRTKAIVPVHLYGQSADMTAIMQIANKHDLRVVEDCAQAIGALHHNKAAGSFGDIGCLSFFPSKNLGAFGDAGMALTDSPALAEQLDVLRRQGGKKKYFHEVLGFNSRLDTIQAAILNVKLNHLDTWNEGRRRVAANYNVFFASANLPVVTPVETPGNHHVYHQYTIRTSNRQALADHLKANGVSTMVYYPVPLHQQPLYSHIATLHLPESEKAAEEVLSLPISPGLTESDQRQVTDAIRSFF